MVPGITVAPSPLMVGVLRTGQAKTAQLVAHGREPFRIVAISCNDPRFRFAHSREPNTLHQIGVTFTAGETPGTVTAAVRIQTDRAPAHDLQVAVHARVVPNPPSP